MEDFARTFFDPVDANAPWFFNLTFLLGCWGIMIGGFYLFEKYSRSFRKKLFEKTEGNFIINGMNVRMVAFEIAVNQLSRIGRFTGLLGLILVVIGVVGAVFSHLGTGK